VKREKRYLKMPRGILERRSSGPSGSCYREASATKTKDRSNLFSIQHKYYACPNCQEAGQTFDPGVAEKKKTISTIDKEVNRKGQSTTFRTRVFNFML
jgi:hypothetical protein